MVKMFFLSIRYDIIFMFESYGYISVEEEYYYIIDFVYDIMYDGYNELRNFYFVVLE